MNRVSLKCANCGNQDLEIEITIVPRGIHLACNKMGCGRITPIAFWDEAGHIYAVNNEASAKLYDEGHCRDITMKEAREVANINN